MHFSARNRMLQVSDINLRVQIIIPDDDAFAMFGTQTLALTEQNNIDVLFRLEELNFEICLLAGSSDANGYSFLSIQDIKSSAKLKDIA